jgi:anti-sigma-K factor RskA
MADLDALAEAGHEDAAGWVLGILDPDDHARFEAHLTSCQACQQAVADLGAPAMMLKAALPVMETLPVIEPPAGLRARTLAAVEQAAKKSARRRWTPRRTISAAAVAVIAAVAAIIASLVGSAAPALAFTIPLHATTYGGAASGSAVAHHTSDGWSIQLNVSHLKPLPSGQFYECWYAGPGNRPGHPDLITAGTFTVGASGSASVQMWSAADPQSFPDMQITAERPGDAGQHGQVILSGVARK